MSYEVCVLEYAPDIKENAGLSKWDEGKERLRQALPILFSRNHHVVHEVKEKEEEKVVPSPVDSLSPSESPEPETVTDKKTDEVIAKPTTLRNLCNASRPRTRWEFTRYHLWRWFLYWALQCLYETYETLWSPIMANMEHFNEPELGSVFRRLPQSLHYEEMYFRAEQAFDWNVVSLWMYDSYHSFFALLWVSVLRLGPPEEWKDSLFGPFSEASSVRGYWGKHWHNFVYHSLCGHVKCITRGWFGLQRGTLTTRILENTLVFFISGLMHTAVRRMQDPESEIWYITYWYVGQMIPILMEMAFSAAWYGVRKRLGVREDLKWLNRAEYWVGYAWTTSWFMYSITKYTQARSGWYAEQWRKIYEAEWTDADFVNTSVNGMTGNETE
jgi:hypothetical protein